MNLIFLDVDVLLAPRQLATGIFETPKTNAPDRIFGGSFDAEAVGRLNALVAETSASIVIASKWVKIWSAPMIARALAQLGVKSRVFGAVPIGKSPTYGIDEWLEGYEANMPKGAPRIGNYTVILPDANDVHRIHWAHTVTCDRLDEVAARRAARVLSALAA